MILEWLAPVSAILLGARLVRMHVRDGWRDWTDLLAGAGSVLLAYVLVRLGFDVRHSLGETLVVSPIMLTIALVPSRLVFRLIGAKRPNEIEDPELFEDGELKPGAEPGRLPGPDQD